MPPERFPPGSARDWLARAKGDLSLSRIELPDGAFFEDLCFHAQQAAEKALKAVYVHHDWTFRYIHDLAELIDDLETHRLGIPDAVKHAIGLNTYAHDTRYPGLGEPVTSGEHRQAVDMASAVVEWAEKVMGIPTRDS